MTPSTTPTPANLHFNLGQFIALALLGLSAYHAQDTAGSGGAKIFLDPAVISPYLQGLISIFVPAQAAAAAPAAPAATV